MSEHPGLPDHIRDAILALISQYQQRGSITVAQLDAALPSTYSWHSRDIEDALELIAEGGLRIEWE